MTSRAADSPTWQWPQDLPGSWEQDNTHPPQNHKADPTESAASSDPSPWASYTAPPGTRSPKPEPRQERFYRPRTCRICLEVVLPTSHPPSEHLAGVFQSSTPSVTYESEDGGRLLRPCLCKGSQKYVHEGCLTAWRLQNPMEKRNYWQCPTCKYNYNLERMTWGRLISSTASQIGLTVAIFLVAAFFLGYVADPIINLYIDPYDSLTEGLSHGTSHLYDDEPTTWIEHFLKGMASLGLLGFAKFLLTLSPWQWWNWRSSGLMGGGHRRGNTGRDRISQIGWITVMVGIVTVLLAVWKGVRAWSRRTLENVSEKVVDVPGDDRDDEDE
ncbi:hypothetical protein AAFC00_006114 [Neodothiora populina]|uniref:RING-CH-type domain-containing protein n=1 Tax=Neodothiora populina TaxID=2781224 RepID=A0ABR3P434_9PEZI